MSTLDNFRWTKKRQGEFDARKDGMTKSVFVTMYLERKWEVEDEKHRRKQLKRWEEARKARAAADPSRADVVPEMGKPAETDVVPEMGKPAETKMCQPVGKKYGKKDKKHDKKDKKHSKKDKKDKKHDKKDKKEKQCENEKHGEN